MIRLRTAGALQKMCLSSDSETGWPIWLCRKARIVSVLGGTERGYDSEAEECVSSGSDDGLADKLSNMRDIDRDYPAAGEQLWTRFRMQSKEAAGLVL